MLVKEGNLKMDKVLFDSDRGRGFARKTGQTVSVYVTQEFAI